MDEELEGERVWCMALRIVFDQSLWGVEGSSETMKLGTIAVLRDTISKMEAFDYNIIKTANAPFSWWQGTVKHPVTDEVVSYRWIGVDEGGS